MFHLRPVAAENEDFLYRAYPKDWTVARKPKLGPPKVRRKDIRTHRDLNESGHNQSPTEFIIAVHSLLYSATPRSDRTDRPLLLSLFDPRSLHPHFETLPLAHLFVVVFLYLALYANVFYSFQYCRSLK